MEIRNYSDTSSLVHLRLAELVSLETIRIHFPDTTHTATRSIYLKETLRDTLLSTSIALRADTVSGSSQTISTGPLMVESNKGVKRGFAPWWFWVVLIFFVFFAGYWFCLKKKL